MAIPPECQTWQDQIALAEGKVQQTLEQLEGTAPAERAALFQQLKSLTASLNDLQDKLGNCIVNSNQVGRPVRGHRHHCDPEPSGIGQYCMLYPPR
jgi:predicted  nucleic acid-binding Zn-ribbon protein